SGPDPSRAWPAYSGVAGAGRQAQGEEGDSRGGTVPRGRAGVSQDDRGARAGAPEGKRAQPRLLQALRAYAAGLRADRVRPAAVSALARAERPLKRLRAAHQASESRERAMDVGWKTREADFPRAACANALHWRQTVPTRGWLRPSTLRSRFGPGAGLPPGGREAQRRGGGRVENARSGLSTRAARGSPRGGCRCR